MNFEVGQIIHVDDLMQKRYRYKLVAPMGKDFAPEFRPHFSPKRMLELGIFEGKYCNDCRGEFPANWFSKAKLSARADPGLNCFGIKSRQSLQVWQDKGWIVPPDPRGWFQWYCRYFLGRRIVSLDAWQIKRWKAFVRHRGQILAHCLAMDLDCRPRQRQALLQWSYDPFI